MGPVIAPPTSPAASRALLLAGAAGGLVVAATGGRAALGLRLALIVGAMVAVGVGLRLHRPGRIRPWLFVLAGMALSGIGDTVVLVELSRRELTGNLPLDSALTALAGVMLLLGMLDATRAIRGSDLGGVLDAITFTIAGGVLVWHVFVVSSATAGWMGSWGEVTAISHILLMLTVLALLVRTTAALPPTARTAALLLTVAVLAALTAFTIGATREAAGVAWAYTGTRAGFGAFANVCVGAAALHRSMRVLTEPLAPVVERASAGRTVALGAALLVPPAILLTSAVSQDRAGVATLAVAWVALVPVVLARLHLSSRSRDLAQQRVLTTERRLLSVIAHSGDTILLVATPDDGVPRITFASPAAHRLLGHDPEHLVGLPVGEFAVPDDADLLTEIVMAGGTYPRTADVRVTRADASECWVEVIVDVYDDDHDPAVVTTLRDITARKRAEMHWAEAAVRDPLTGLLNRRGIDSWLDDELLTPERAGRPVAVLVCDLDRFKRVNDLHGHAVGDAILCESARRIERHVRDGDVVARVGGDEFLIVCAEVDDLFAIDAVARRLIEAVAEPVVVDDVPVRVGLSVGVAVGDGRESIAALLRQADGALYRAKAEGRGRVAWCDVAQPAV